jgi:hypothetical protein|tara:strand:+ start:1884 stop:2342 length:459 start_codon:yes stop_codon:yes gene_type:complete
METKPMKKITLLLITVFILFSGCTMVNHSITTPVIYLSDLDISDEVWGQAKSVKIFGIDFSRLLKRNIESANIGMSTSEIPIIGPEITGIPAFQSVGLTIINTESLALQDLLKKNSEYDVLISPKYSRTIDGFWPIYWTETVMVKARIGKIK